MNIEREERECRKALAAAERLAVECRKHVATFPPEGRELGERLVAAADRTVLNLRLALAELRKPEGVVN